MAELQSHHSLALDGFPQRERVGAECRLSLLGLDRQIQAGNAQLCRILLIEPLDLAIQRERLMSNAERKEPLQVEETMGGS
jgi:hypothetical protein